MRRLLLISALSLCILGMAGCSNNSNQQQNLNQDVQNTTDDKNTQEAETVEDIAAVDILQKTWDAVAENDKFPCFGGNVENPVDNGAGDVPTSDENMFSSTLLVPSDVVEKTTEAASLMHMMNSNTFTSAAIKLDGMNTEEAANKIKDNFKSNQFMCGIPEKIVIATYGNVVAYAYGDAVIVDDFMSKMETVTGAKIIIDENY